MALLSCFGCPGKHLRNVMCFIVLLELACERRYGQGHVTKVTQGERCHMAWLEARRVKFISKRVVWWAREAERAPGGSMHCRRLSVPTRCGGVSQVRGETRAGVGAWLEAGGTRRRGRRHAGRGMAGGRVLVVHLWVSRPAATWDWSVLLAHVDSPWLSKNRL